ncbi:anti-sigma regulatory factor [Spirosoma fluminis]
MLNTTPIEVLTANTFSVRQESDVIPFISHIRDQAGRLGMNSVNQTKLTTAASELARNMINYASGGDARLEQVRQADKDGFRIIFMDKGPGIADIEKAMETGYSTGAGMGLGLPGAKRLVNEFTLASEVGKGTTVTILKWTNG